LSKTLATVPMGTGVASEIAELFDNVITWNQDANYDAILFEGGSDIHPKIYGAENTDSGVGNDLSHRDKVEIKAFKDAINKKALIIGICRGAQLACALAGGKLVQHVNRHGGEHNVTTKTGDVFKVSSVHHQMMYPWDIEHTLLAWSSEKRSDVYKGYQLDEAKHVVEPEACFFPQIKALAFQWHPEWAASNEELDFTISHIKDKL